MSAPPEPEAQHGSKATKAGEVLPVPEGDVVLGPDDARRALALFDATFPQWAGLLDAKVINDDEPLTR